MRVENDKVAWGRNMECRVGCGACCIALSISSPIPGMPGGKPAGVRCIQLTSDNRCRLYGRPERPEVCRRLRPSQQMCGSTFEEAFRCLTELEALTAPVATADSAAARPSSDRARSAP